MSGGSPISMGGVRGDVISLGYIPIKRTPNSCKPTIRSHDLDDPVEHSAPQLQSPRLTPASWVTFSKAGRTFTMTTILEEFRCTAPLAA